MAQELSCPEPRGIFLEQGWNLPGAPREIFLGQGWHPPADSSPLDHQGCLHPGFFSHKCFRMAFIARAIVFGQLPSEQRLKREFGALDDIYLFRENLYQ